MKNTYRLSVLIVSTAWIGSLLLTGCQDGNRMHAHWEPGNTFSQKVTMVSDMLLPMGFANADHKESEVRLDYEVKEVDPDHASIVEVRIAAIKASVNTIGVVCDYDSTIHEKEMPELDKSDKRYRIKQEFWRDFNELLGTKFTVLINREGQVVKFIDVDDKIRNIMNCTGFGSTSGDQMAFLLSESNLREYVEMGMYGGMGADQPKTGEEWQAQAVVEIPRAEAVMAQKTYVLDQVKREENQDVAEISYKTAMLDDASLPAHYPEKYKKVRAKLGMKILEVAGKGQIRYSLSQARLLKLDEQRRIRIVPAKGVAPAGKRKRENKMYYQVHKTIEYVKD